MYRKILGNHFLKVQNLSGQLYVLACGISLEIILKSKQLQNRKQVYNKITFSASSLPEFSLLNRFLLK